jgi:hypothetical protein
MLLGRAERVVEVIAVWFSQHENVDVAHWPLPGLPRVPRCPGSVDPGLSHAPDRPEGFGQNGRNPERPGQDVG